MKYFIIKAGISLDEDELGVRLTPVHASSSAQTQAELSIAMWTECIVTLGVYTVLWSSALYTEGRPARPQHLQPGVFIIIIFIYLFKLCRGILAAKGNGPRKAGARALSWSEEGWGVWRFRGASSSCLVVAGVTLLIVFLCRGWMANTTHKVDWPVSFPVRD